MSSKLRPCPFCAHENSDPTLERIKEPGPESMDFWVVRCGYCGARGPEESRSAKAVESWNRRANDGR